MSRNFLKEDILKTKRYMENMHSKSLIREMQIPEVLQNNEVSSSTVRLAHITKNKINQCREKGPSFIIGVNVT